MKYEEDKKKKKKKKKFTKIENYNFKGYFIDV